jgi:hypothetical protein
LKPEEGTMHSMQWSGLAKLTVPGAGAIGGDESFKERFGIAHIFRAEFQATRKALKNLPPGFGPHVRSELIPP